MHLYIIVLPMLAYGLYECMHDDNFLNRVAPDRLGAFVHLYRKLDALHMRYAHLPLLTTLA